MSGGAFGYIQDRLEYSAIEPIREAILENRKPPIENPDNEWDKEIVEDFHKNGDRRYSDETMEEFKTALEVIQKAAVYMERIDYLLSGDDGEEEFHKRLKEDLNKVDNKMARERALMKGLGL